MKTLSAFAAGIFIAALLSQIFFDRHDAMIPVVMTRLDAFYSGSMHNCWMWSHSCRKMVGIPGQSYLIAPAISAGGEA